MKDNKNPPIPADNGDMPETAAGRSDTECVRCVHVSGCPDAHGMPGACDAFIDRRDAR